MLTSAQFAFLSSAALGLPRRVQRGCGTGARFPVKQIT